MNDMLKEIPSTVTQGDPIVDSTDFIVPAEVQESAEPEPSLPEFPGFVVESTIARGGMGIVYLAVDLQLSRRVAIKTIPIDKSFTPKQRERFDREVSSLAELHHPNVVQLYRIGSADERPFMVLEYVCGTNLSQILRTGPLPFRTAAIITEKIASAIVCAHSFNILHRDLTPSNVLIGVVSARDMIENSIAETQGSLCEHFHETNFDFSDIELKVSDFGLAQLEIGAEQLTRTGGVVGTPGYLAPEAIDSTFGRVSQQTDIYGLGAILYAMLTGRAPFVASNINESFSQVTNTEVLVPSVLRPNVCPDLQTICLKCLEKHSKDRYDSATDLLEDLRRYLNGQSILAKPPSILRRGHTWARNNQLAILLSIGIVILGLTLSTATAIQKYQFNKQKETARIVANSKRHLDLIQSRFDSNIQTVRTVGIFLECQKEIDRESFEHFCNTAIGSQSSLVTWEWLPRIEYADRISHEAHGQREYGKDYAICWRSADNGMVPAGLSPDYFPVFYLVPLAQNEQALGFDVSHEKTRSEALIRAKRMQDVALTQKIQLVQDGESCSVLACMPVYSLSDEELRGFAVGVFRIESIVQPVLANAGSDEGIIIRDTSNHSEIIFKSENLNTPGSKLESSGHKSTREIEIGGRSWNLSLISSINQQSRSSKELPGHLFTIGVLITILIAGLPLLFTLFQSKNRSPHQIMK